MSDEQEYARIAAMTEGQLLDYVLGAPELLTDSYYRGFATAVRMRHSELVALREDGRFVRDLDALHELAGASWLGG